MVIHKGEQFAIPFEVKIGDNIVTPYDIDGLRIKVNDILAEWPDGNLEFDDINGVWLFWLEESETLNMFAGRRPAQIAVKIGDNIIKSDVFDLDVKSSIITELWNDE